MRDKSLTAALDNLGGVKRPGVSLRTEDADSDVRARSDAEVGALCLLHAEFEKWESPALPAYLNF